jgi:hypothetical protein
MTTAGEVRISGIADVTDAATIDVVRGRLDRKRADELLSFWFERRALSGLEARRRLPEVVCMLRRDGGLVGTSSAYAANVALIGNRRFWVFRSLLDAVAAPHLPDMIRATFKALEAEFDGSPGAPIGLCVLAGPDERNHRPEAEWADPRMTYAGYLPEALQVRIAYFEGAVIG